MCGLDPKRNANQYFLDERVPIVRSRILRPAVPTIFIELFEGLTIFRCQGNLYAPITDCVQSPDEGHKIEVKTGNPFSECFEEGVSFGFTPLKFLHSFPVSPIYTLRIEAASFVIVASCSKIELALREPHEDIMGPFLPHGLSVVANRKDELNHLPLLVLAASLHVEF